MLTTTKALLSFTAFLNVRFPQIAHYWLFGISQKFHSTRFNQRNSIDLIQISQHLCMRGKRLLLKKVFVNKFGRWSLPKWLKLLLLTFEECHDINCVASSIRVKTHLIQCLHICTREISLFVHLFSWSQGVEIIYFIECASCKCARTQEREKKASWNLLAAQKMPLSMDFYVLLIGIFFCGITCFFPFVL